MVKKLNITLKTVLCIVIVCTFAVGWCILTGASDAYISELTIATGKDAVASLEKSGNNVLFQGLNIGAEEDSIVALGYKTGSDAVTGIIVSSQLRDSLSVDGCRYTPVSKTSLNAGTSGAALYLYFTKDSKAGTGITSLDTVTGYADSEDVIPLLNDGSSPVRTDEGKLANLDEGINDNRLYLLVNRADDLKEYVSDAIFIKGTSKSQMVAEAVNNGCDYYLQAGGNSGLIAYQRSSKRSEAINALSFDGENLTVTHDPASKAYLVGISNIKLGSSFEYGNWFKAYAATTNAISKSSPVYDKKIDSKSPCTCVQLSRTPVICAVFVGTVDEAVIEAQTETQAQTSAQETTTLVEVTDEYIGLEKEDETTQADEELDKEASSVISSGNIKAILILSAIAIVILIYFILKNRKVTKYEKQMD